MDSSGKKANQTNNEFVAVQVPESYAGPVDPNMVIIPSIVKREIDDIEVEAILMGTTTDADADDVHQHYFTDKLNFERPKYSRGGYGAMAMIAFAVDVTNFMDFPTNVANNGGICYIVMYLVTTVFGAYPLCYLEAIVGQYFQSGMIGIWGICPMAKGLGIALVYLLALLVSTLSANTLWATHMVGTAFASIWKGETIWLTCDEDWNTCDCITTRQEDCIQMFDNLNITNRSDSSAAQSASFEHFTGKILQIYKSKYADPNLISNHTRNGNWSEAYGFNNQIDAIGIMIPGSTIILGVILVLILIISCLEQRHVGYFYMFTAIYCLIITALMFCRAVALEGAFKGLQRYMTPDYTIFYNYKVWFQAFMQSLFSPGGGFGMYVVLSSYNQLHNNVKKDVIVAISADVLISILGSMIAFMFLGHYSVKAFTPIPEKFPGDEFIYVAFVQSLGITSGSEFFAICYFTMIMLVSFDTLLSVLRCIAYSMFEEYKRKFPQQTVSKHIFIFTPWVLTFILSIFNTTRGGYWNYTFFKRFLFDMNFKAIMALQMIFYPWVWGIEELCIACDTVSGHRPGLILRFLWKFFLPASVLTIFATDVIYSFSRESTFEVFHLPAPRAVIWVGRAAEWLAYAIFLIYGTYNLRRLWKKTIPCKVIFLMWISPEYEHQEILEDSKCRKRASFSHYIFIKFSDENWGTLIKNEFNCKIFKRKKKTEGAQNQSNNGPLRETEPGKVRPQLDTRRRQTNLWDMVKLAVKEPHHDTNEEEEIADDEGSKSSLKSEIETNGDKDQFKLRRDQKEKVEPEIDKGQTKRRKVEQETAKHKPKVRRHQKVEPES